MRTRKDRPLVIGHRGAPALAPENTLASFAAALDAGLDGIEIDVHRTRDGVLAVHHDPSTPEGVQIARTDWSDLRGTAPSIPRLEEVLELVDGRDGSHLNIELKSSFPFGDGRAALLATTLARWNGPGASRTWISSFDPFALVELRRLRVDVPIALLMFGEAGLAIPRLVPALDVAGYHVERGLVTAERVRSWHEAGLFVFTWTVNTADDARAARDAGVDGVIGDHPDRLLAIAR